MLNARMLIKRHDNFKRQFCSLPKDELKDVFLHGKTHADMPIFPDGKKHFVEWCIYSNSYEHGLFPVEIVRRDNMRMTKRVFDMLLLSMRLGFPDECVALVKVDGLLVMTVAMVYRHGMRVLKVARYGDADTAAHEYVRISTERRLWKL